MFGFAVLKLSFLKIGDGCRWGKMGDSFADRSEEVAIEAVVLETGDNKAPVFLSETTGDELGRPGVVMKVSSFLFSILHSLGDSNIKRFGFLV